MEDLNNHDMTQIMEEIQSIKKIIYQKKPVLNTVLHPKHLKFIMLLIGISISVFSLVLYFLEQRYESYSLLPTSIKDIYTWLAVLVGAIIFVLFFVLWLKSLKKSSSKLTGEHFWSAILSFRVFNVTFPIKIISFILIVYCLEHDMAYYVISILSIGVGLTLNFLGCMTETKNYIIGGYWFMTTAVIIFLYPLIPVSLALLFSMGFGSLIFGFLPTSEKLSDDKF